MFTLINLLLLIITINIQNGSSREFNELPESERDKAQYIFEGRYYEHTSPCIPRGNGLRVRYRQFGFSVERVYKGKMKADYIGIADRLQQTDSNQPLRVDHRYLVMLKPGAEFATIVETGEGCHYYYNTAAPAEIVGIVEIIKDHK